MTTINAGTVLLTFLVFCRIGGCLMLMPGFGSPRIPMQVRIFLAMSVSLALAPMLVPKLEGDLGQLSAPQAAQLIASETLIGATIGIMGRIFLLALQFMGTAAAALIGFTGSADAPVEAGEPAPSLATMLTLTATVLVFVTGLHLEMLRALMASYSVIKITDLFDARFALTKVTNAASDSFFLVGQLASPFLVYSLILNFLFGILNKLTPLIPVYYISAPFLIAGGILLFYFTFSEGLRLFITGFQSFLVNG
ncbi:MAG: flagellar biosynthetic protein FliR [Hyphomicrobium sp.]